MGISATMTSGVDSSSGRSFAGNRVTASLTIAALVPDKAVCNVMTPWTEVGPCFPFCCLSILASWLSSSAGCQGHAQFSTQFSSAILPILRILLSMRGATGHRPEQPLIARVLPLSLLHLSLCDRCGILRTQGHMPSDLYRAKNSLELSSDLTSNLDCHTDIRSCSLLIEVFIIWKLLIVV